MISYAQNLEDVVLNRVFQNKPNGFYIDVGAHDPIELSVTKHFFDLGWHGINIEPVPASYENFKKGRPDDINLNIAVSSKHDFITIYEIEGHPELTSLDKNIAESAGKLMGAKLKSYKIEIRTLTEVCEQYCHGFIDFIKIDVEGAEKDVIEGANWDKFRPTMLAVEATIPNSGSIQDWNRWDENAAWHEWEPLLFEAEYILTYYDGLNRYYLRKEDEYLKNRFAIPVTWLQDQFSLYRDVQETWRLDAENKQLKKGKGDLANQFDALAKERSELLKERDQLKNKETELVSENETLRTTRVRLVQENSSQHALISDLKKQEDGLRKERDELIAMSEAHRKRQAELQSELGIKQHELNILRATLEDERFIRQRNPVQRFFESLKPLFPIKEMQYVDKAEITTTKTTIPKSKTYEGSETKQTKTDFSRKPTPPFIPVGGLNNVLNDIHFEISQHDAYFMSCMDTELPVIKTPLEKPWFGVVHTPQGPVPKWWAEAADGMFETNESLFQSSAWGQSKNTCRGLITFSKSHVENLRKLTDIQAESILCPIPAADIKWSPQAFKENKKKKIIQWGWWMRRIHAIHLLWECPFIRVFIQDFSDTAQNIFNVERNELAKQNLFFDFMEEGLETSNGLGRTNRFEMLQANIAFVHYYATSAPDAVLDCIATHTPILVNALPSIIEYLGEDYPFYYYSYAEAIEKVQKSDLVLKAYEYLRRQSEKRELSPTYFKQEIKNFCSSREQV
jgi:FkbM family methyltransferase